MPVNVATWQYAIVIAFVLIGELFKKISTNAPFLTYLPAMVVTVVMLVMIHKRIRLKHYSELREYYEEQLRYVSTLR